MKQPPQERFAESSGPSPAHMALMYGVMIVGAIVLFLTVDSCGEGLVAPGPGPPGARDSATVGGKPDALVHVLVALTAVLLMGRLLSLLFLCVRQPPVIGEVIGGILLGPSVLGRLWPEAAAFVLPPSVAPFLGVIAHLGVILYMFLVGLELSPAVLSERAHATVAISHASIIVPFLLGATMSLLLYPRLSSSDVSFTSFALFVGVAMSITAFPVLARILTDQRMQRTQMGIIALGCAATDDLTAWCLLALVVGVVQAKMGGAFLVLGLTAAFLAIMLLVVRPVVARLLARLGETQLTPGVVALVFAAVMVSALTTEWIGIHTIFGAFLLGAIIPHDSVVARAFPKKMGELVTVLLLPAFFAFTGMRTRIGLVSGLEHWLICGLIIAVATAGKFGGALLAARLTGLGWRESAVLGILMNTRGLMELIVLNIGLDLNVISPTLFAMMVLMALVTTTATTPVLQWLTPGSSPSAHAGLVWHGEWAVHDAPGPTP
ncbi:MAG TPA: cation:proton antiporter [Isosphaeraceae bacterium]|nr:cation:proton antiporter [Isosphaeraceae bacterium]